MSRLVVEFESERSAHFSLGMDDVTPLQLLSLAGYLEFMAKFELNQFQVARIEEEAKKHIQVPKSQIVVSHK